ncbi:MAG: hypothetical protein ACYDBX_00405 [Patescibacteria group bacterium]
MKVILKVLKIIVPVILLIVLVYIYINFHPNTSKINASKPKKGNVTVIPKLSFYSNTGITIQKSQPLSIVNPNNNSNFYYTSLKNPYAEATNLGISYPPTLSKNGQISWSSSNISLIYSNGSFFYSSTKGSQGNVSTYINNVLSGLTPQGVSYKKVTDITQNEIIVYVYPKITNQYIYLTNGNKFFYTFSFYLNDSIKSFSIYPLSLTTKKGQTLSITSLNHKTLKMLGFYANISGAISNISITKEDSGYFFDPQNKAIIPIYIIYGNADIINLSIKQFILYVPEVKTI